MTGKERVTSKKENRSIYPFLKSIVYILVCASLVGIYIFVYLISHKTPWYFYTSSPEIFYDPSHPPVLITSHTTSDSLPLRIIKSVIYSCIHNPLQRSTEKSSLSAKDIYNKISALPYIEKCHVEFFNQQQIFIQYTLRSPLALIYEKKHVPRLSRVRPHKSQVAFDKNGICFYIDDIYSPKFLPEVILPFDHRMLPLQRIANTPHPTYAIVIQKIIEYINSCEYISSRYTPSKTSTTASDLIYNIRLHRIDISKLFHYNYFQREVILSFIVEKGSSSNTSVIYFRIHPQHYVAYTPFFEKLLQYAIEIKKEKPDEPIVIDMRYERFCMLYQGREDP